MIEPFRGTTTQTKLAVQNQKTPGQERIQTYQVYFTKVDLLHCSCQVYFIHEIAQCVSEKSNLKFCPSNEWIVSFTDSWSLLLRQSPIRLQILIHGFRWLKLQWKLVSRRPISRNSLVFRLDTNWSKFITTHLDFG